MFAAIALAFVAVSCLPTPADGAPQATSTRMVRVETSDSLWSIAREHATKGMSVPATVEAIRRLNRMEGSDQLHPGTFVAVPCPHAIDAVFALR